MTAPKTPYRPTPRYYVTVRDTEGTAVFHGFVGEDDVCHLEKTADAPAYLSLTAHDMSALMTSQNPPSHE